MWVAERCNRFRVKVEFILLKRHQNRINLKMFFFFVPPIMAITRCPRIYRGGGGMGGGAPERNSCKHIHKTAAGGSASAAMHRLSDSIVFPNKHRHPLKWNKHKQRVKGTVNRGVVCPLGLGSGGRRSAGTYEKKGGNKRIKTWFDGGNHDILVSAARIKRSGRGCGTRFVSNDIYSCISIFGVFS